MDPKELQELLTKAVDLGKELKEKNEALESQVKTKAEELNELKSQFESMQQQIADGGGDAGELESIKAKFEEAMNEVSDLRTKFRTPAQVAPENVKAALREIARKSFNTFIKDAKKEGHTDFSRFSKSIENEVKTLNLGDGSGTAGAAVAEILSMDLIEYGREFSPILGEISMRSGLTRDFRELVLSKYPVIADGIEGVPGTDFAATDTQEYGEVKTDVIKLMANAPITDEAFYGTTYNVYSDLVRLLGDQLAVTFAAKVLYGNGADKNGRGILSSSRVDITASTGESWKASMGTDARDHDVFPAHATGVDGALGADDEAIMDLVEDIIAKLPTKYLAGASWKMNRKTRATFAKVRDADNRPIFKRSMIEGGIDRIAGFPVKIDDTMPDIASDSLPIIFGDLKRAFAMSNGDISYMQLNPYKTQGLTYVEHNHEIFTIMQASDAIIVVAATANATS